MSNYLLTQEEMKKRVQHSHLYQDMPNIGGFLEYEAEVSSKEIKILPPCSAGVRVPVVPGRRRVRFIKYL